MSSRHAAAALLAAASCWLIGVPAASSTESPISVDAEPFAIDPRGVARGETFAHLAFVGGLSLSSTHPAFGGFSGLVLADDPPRLIAVSDRGHWLRGTLTETADRVPTGIAEVSVAPILDPNGAPLTGGAADAEGLASLDPERTDGDVVVSFERQHRLWRYPLGAYGLEARPVPVLLPALARQLRSNQGLEGVTVLKSGQLVLLSEETLNGDGHILGWAAAPSGTFEPLALKRYGQYALTDLATLPDGDVLTLERRFSLIGGPGVAIRRLSGARMVPGAVLDGPVLLDLDGRYTIDNMEGLAVRQIDGRTFVYMISDDNFSLAQRTLLAVYELKD